MLTEERAKRVKQAIAESKDLLIKALEKYNNSILSLDMEIRENKELGNSEDANDHARKYKQECCERCEWLNSHIIKLENMLL